MGRENRPGRREGRVVLERVDDRWSVQLELDERKGDEATRLRVDVPGAFATEETAASAGQSALEEWRTGRVATRELVLRELAAVYRQLRQKHKPMEPVAVPATSTAWERALGLWELAAWLDAAESARYREHARLAFDTATAPVKHHRLSDVEGPAQ